jgi:hypothetical protein
LVFYEIHENMYAAIAREKQIRAGVTSLANLYEPSRYN